MKQISGIFIVLGMIAIPVSGLFYLASLISLVKDGLLDGDWASVGKLFGISFLVCQSEEQHVGLRQRYLVARMRWIDRQLSGSHLIINR